MPVTKQPFLVQCNRWWYVYVDEQGYLHDKFMTTKQYYKLYSKIEKLEFEEFLIKAKAGKINFNI